MNSRSRVVGGLVAMGGLLLAHPTAGQEQAKEQVSSFAGSFSQSVAIAVPPYRGVEPGLALQAPGGKVLLRLPPLR